MTQPDKAILIGREAAAQEYEAAGAVDWIDPDPGDPDSPGPDRPGPTSIRAGAWDDHETVAAAIRAARSALAERPDPQPPADVGELVGQIENILTGAPLSSTEVARTIILCRDALTDPAFVRVPREVNKALRDSIAAFEAADIEPDTAFLAIYNAVMDSDATLGGD